MASDDNDMIKPSISSTPSYADQVYNRGKGNPRETPV